jgi:diamine N-acetyltransferase
MLEPTRRRRIVMTTDKTVSLREITEDTLRPILKMEVAAGQKQYVAPNAVSIAQAHFSKYAWFRAIYAGDDAVGFAMLSIDTEKSEYYLWRFMIGEEFQGNGYGYRAMELVIDFARTLPNAEEFSLSYVRGPGDPSGFYAKLGFVDTGEMIEGEHIMVLKWG